MSNIQDARTTPDNSHSAPWNRLPSLAYCDQIAMTNVEERHVAFPEDKLSASKQAEKQQGVTARIAAPVTKQGVSASRRDCMWRRVMRYDKAVHQIYACGHDHVC